MARISFTSRKGFNPPDQAPKTFDVIASNDCQSWKVLLSVPNAGFVNASQTKSWDIPRSHMQSYECYGLNIEASNTEPEVCVANITMYH